ncbi:dysbindin domain-containing protein 2 isoform X1 [Zonotrichia albicollis]|uniref:Dysbindin domain containing 2 n=2 Tax=Zonotrichia TaxID=44387 RepID=A0A8D2N8B1_ZONAL|nr:dysbindin domain-containing protein 2 isoform X1 [Zonotrichia albicollis]
MGTPRGSRKAETRVRRTGTLPSMGTGDLLILRVHGKAHPRQRRSGTRRAGGRRGRGAAAMGAPVPPRAAPSAAPQRALGERRRRRGARTDPRPPARPGPARSAGSSRMSGPGAQSRSRRLPAEMEQAQRNLDAEQMQQQQLKLRDRQKFFEEVFQHDVDFFFPMSHLQIEHRRPPLGSISSMEVNVDMLEQMDVLDLSDQDTVDVFLGCGTEESSIAGSLPGADASQCPEEITLQVPNAAESKSRISSTSSASTDLNSLDTSEEGAETPVVQSDEEELQEDSPKEQVVRS